MQKKGKLSRLTVNLLIGFLILCLAIIIFIIVRGYVNEQDKYEVYTDEKIDLKISQIKKVDDNTLELTLKRGVGEGKFIGLSFSVTDGNRVEVVRVDTSMPENQVGNFSLKFIELNASNIKKISVTPIYLNEKGEEVIGNVKDEYINPNICSTYCPPNAQCGTNGCGAPCGNGCAKGYLCLDYKCVKDKTSSSGGSSGGSSGSGSSNKEDDEETCKDTCLSLVKQCGTHTICGKQTNCGTCSEGYTCSSGLCILEETCKDTCNSLNYNCGTHTICGKQTNCGTCQSPLICAPNGTCIRSCIPTTCQALGRNCGTVSDGCGGTLTCGNYGGGCQRGYSCANNGTCMKDVVISCGSITCNSGEYCSNGVCLLNVSGNTYFVATNGNDNNPGTFERPWKTWQKGVQVAKPGDIVYIRGGVWQPTQHVMSGSYDTGTIGMGIDPTYPNSGVSGTANAPIRYYNYPGETPILDGSLLSPNRERWQNGIGISHAEYIYFKGLTVRNIFQSPPDFTHAKPHSEVFGIGSFESANLRFENMVVYNVNGRGFQHWSGAWNEGDGPGALFEYDNTSYINCDAYNLFDRYSSSPGNAADGWYLVGYYGNYYMYEGCRAWNYSDDGFNTNGAGYTSFKNCWAMSTHSYDGMGWIEGGGVEGNGFKTTGVGIAGIDNYKLFGENFVRIENSIAVDCVGVGIITNLQVDYQTDWPSNAVVSNNLAYKCAGNFWDSGTNNGATRTTNYRNNIAYKSTDQSGRGYGLPDPLYEVGIYRPSIYPHSNNTWRAKSGEDWPGWEYNPAYTVTDSDFVSLDTSQLMRPRKADFSLPDITFGHLARGSDLIDGGVYIPGYHCLTAGAHPGENCREWYGLAPDLGPFESNY